MERLRQAIMEKGHGIGNDIVQVGSFLNHGLDTGLLFEMGAAIAGHFRHAHPDLIMTVEASGIALAITTAHALDNLPVLFCKKSTARNQDEALYTTQVVSYTHGASYQMRCARDLLPKGKRVLIVDDFLADGQAIQGMLDLVRQAGATAVGAAVGIEKGFRPGGQRLRAQGLEVLSLSIVRQIKDGKLLLSED